MQGSVSFVSGASCAISDGVVLGEVVGGEKSGTQLRRKLPSDCGI